MCRKEQTILRRPLFLCQCQTQYTPLRSRDNLHKLLTVPPRNSFGCRTTGDLKVSTLRTLMADGISCRAGSTVMRWSPSTPSTSSRLRVQAMWCTFGLMRFSTAPSSLHCPYRHIRFLSTCNRCLSMQEGVLIFQFLCLVDLRCCCRVKSASSWSFSEREESIIPTTILSCTISSCNVP